MTKRLTALALALILCAMSVSAFAKTTAIGGVAHLEEAQDTDVSAKMTKTDARITAYLGFLQEAFDEEIDITYVGIVDINKDKLPELFYVTREDGISKYGLCGYADFEVFEYEVDEGYLGKAPSGLSLIRYSKYGTSDHCWLLRATTTKKNEDSRFERLVYKITRSGETINENLYFSKDWKSGKKLMRYYIEGAETIESVYEAEKDEFFYDWAKAATTTYKNRAVIRKVASQKWAKIKSALSSAALGWKLLDPITLS